MLEKTLVILKPDAVSRGLADQIINWIEQTGLKIAIKKELSLSKEQAAELYSPHLGKKFYPGLLNFITSGPVIVCIVEGEAAIAKMRELMGATDPREASPGTIRGDLKEANVLNPEGIIKNLIHGSDSPESADREIIIFFK